MLLFGCAHFVRHHHHHLWYSNRKAIVGIVCFVTCIFVSASNDYANLNDTYVEMPAVAT